jgi:oxygen-independent coproporphyrinogen-3 oxidase
MSMIALTAPVRQHQPASLDEARRYLTECLRRPQRHRLLHGYPLAQAMRLKQSRCAVEDITFPTRPGDRGLLVGVLPHPFCNPALTGCGFCTFPHEAYRSDRAAEVVEAVAHEVEQRLQRQPELHRRRIAGLYFGGGTANLSPAGPFRRLCRALAEALDLSDAEVTLEGVPIYFVQKQPPLVDVMREELPARHFRLSMGVQTFDEARLRQMGRQAFGDERTFRQVVELAHSRGLTVSGDLLFNLPGQSLDEMHRDVHKADEIGLDHLGLYHLVLFRGLGTAWSRDPQMLASLPDNETAAGRWVELRDQLHGAGFVQATLTNFERSRYSGDPRRFVYEEHSFRPDRYDMLGFGPGAVSFSSYRRFHGGLKVLNPVGAADYLAAVGSGKPAWDRLFDYDSGDLRVLYLTRRLAALSIDRQEYRGLFFRDVTAEFRHEVEALREAELITVTPRVICPTPRGMFYADSIAALLARRQVRARRAEPGDWGLPLVDMNSNGFGHM